MAEHSEHKYKNTESVEDKDWYKGMIKYMARQRVRQQEAANARKKAMKKRKGQKK